MIGIVLVQRMNATRAPRLDQGYRFIDRVILVGVGAGDVILNHKDTSESVA